MASPKYIPMIYKGASPNQLKPAHVVDSQQKERFFFALEDKELQESKRD